MQARILFDERIADLRMSVDFLQPTTNAADVEILANRAKEAAFDATAMVRLAVGNIKAAEVVEAEGWEEEGEREGRRWLQSAQGAQGAAGAGGGPVDGGKGGGTDGDGKSNDGGKGGGKDDGAVDGEGGGKDDGNFDEKDRGTVDGKDVDGKFDGNVDRNAGGKDDGNDDGRVDGNVDGKIDGKENGDKNGDRKGEKVGVLAEPEPESARWSSFVAYFPPLLI